MYISINQPIHSIRYHQRQEEEEEEEEATMSEKTLRNILNACHEEEDDYFDDRGDVQTTSPAVAGRVHGHAIAALGGVDSGWSYYDNPLLTRLSLESEGDDADAEPSDDENDLAKSSVGGGASSSNRRHRPRIDDSDKDDSFIGKGALSMPGTPVRDPETWAKEYASETDVRGSAGGWRWRGQQARRRTRQERWRDRVWEQKKSQAAEEDEADGQGCRVLVRSSFGGSGRSICMDMDEVRACRDLGFDLPSDWTVEIPGAFSDLTADTSSGGNSPIANWKISSPGDDPKDVKAKLKVWAQAVALVSASASRLGC